MRIGCTGVIGSGKSTVCGLLARHGAVVIDVDAAARAVTNRGGDAFDDIVAAFGDTVLTSTGELDRVALASLVFSDTARRRELEALVHPHVERRVVDALDNVSDDAVAVLDHPLLVETGGRARFRLDGVLVVDVPYDLARHRLVERGLSAEDAAARIASQCTREERLRAADFILMNLGTMAELEEMVERAWTWIQALSFESDRT